ncbi:hypothetical protein COOONC_21326 [Cooperia oncophora]
MFCFYLFLAIAITVAASRREDSRSNEWYRQARGFRGSHGGGNNQMGKHDSSDEDSYGSNRRPSFGNSPYPYELPFGFGQYPEGAPSGYGQWTGGFFPGRYPKRYDSRSKGSSEERHHGANGGNGVGGRRPPFGEFGYNNKGMKPGART